MHVYCDYLVPCISGGGKRGPHVVVEKGEYKDENGIALGKIQATWTYLNTHQTAHIIPQPSSAFSTLMAGFRLRRGVCSPSPAIAE